MSKSISIQNLSKSYELGLTHARSIRELVNGAGRRLIGAAAKKSERETFWALNDISFDVNQGEVVGIIGKNGAGKSTLLKILSQITKPTSGRAVLKGRVASLLEVGTGFHQELTGRENVYLNGTILGMTKKEVAQRFDQIVDFAGIEKFIDTPVKRYSSGMTVRLGFAVAAHLDPEILIVDEVLAVGDVEFQKRCLSKMQDVANSGRTVLFVSHNLASVRNLTSRCIVLKKGRTIFDGDTGEAVEQYVQLNTRSHQYDSNIRDAPRPFEGLTQQVLLSHLSMEEADKTLKPDESIRFEIGLEAQEDVGPCLIGLSVFRNDDLPVGSSFSNELQAIRHGKTVRYTLEIPTPPLAPGQYYCAISVIDPRDSNRQLIDSISNVLPFEISQASFGERQWKSNWGTLRLNSIRVAQPTHED